MKDYKILKFLDIFKGLFEKLDIDYEAMRRILGIKLLLDSRRVSTVLSNNKKPKKDGNNFILSLGFYLLMGVFLIPIVIFSNNFLFQMNIVFGVIIFVLMTSLIGDFSSVLLDLRDKEIILSKPINSRTLNMAKIIHIFIYIFMITMALGGPVLIASFIKYGLLFSLLFLGEIILMSLFAIVATALMYLVVLRFFDGEKLKDIINYVQIGLTIALTVGFQLVARAFEFIDIDKIGFNHTWWKYLVPSIWFAGPFELIINNNREIHIIIYSILALLIPIISMIIYIKLIPSFESNLQKLNSSGGIKRRSGRLTNMIPKLICRTREERTFYGFARNMMRNERTFKLKVYPQLGFGFIFPFIMIFSMSRGMDGGNIFSPNTYYSIYFVGIMVPTLLLYLQYSGNYKGAWIFDTIPIKDRTPIYKGTIKAAFVNLITPVFLLLSIVFFFIYKEKVILDLIATYLILMLYTRISFMLVEKNLPFSKAFEVSQSGGNVIYTIVALMIIVALGGSHFMAKTMTYGLYMYIPILIIANLILWNIGFKSKTIQES